MSSSVIVECLRRYQKHIHGDDGPRKVGPAPLTSINFGQAVIEETPIDRVNELLKDPVRSALRGYVREQGWKYFLAGGTEHMREMAGKIEDGMPEAPSFAGSILDKWWNGIGNDGDFWWS